jgi:hypothetical protein
LERISRYQVLVEEEEEEEEEEDRRKGTAKT